MHPPAGPGQDGQRQDGGVCAAHGRPRPRPARRAQGRRPRGRGAGADARAGGADPQGGAKIRKALRWVWASGFSAVQRPLAGLCFSAPRAGSVAQLTKPFAPSFPAAAGLRVCAAFGGLSKFDQVKELKAGTEVGPTALAALAALITAPTAHHGACAQAPLPLQHPIPCPTPLCRPPSPRPGG